MLTIADKPELDKRIEHDADGPLSKQQLRAIDLLVAGELTTQKVAETLGMSRHHLWRWRSLPAFQNEYRKRLALAEQEAVDLAIARRVKRVEALDELHTKLLQSIVDRAELYADDPYLPARTGLFIKDFKSIGSGVSAYAETVWTLDKATVDALLSIQKQAATELGQWQEKVDVRSRVEVAAPVRVIRFEAQAPRLNHTEIDADYRVTDLLDDATPPPGMARLLAAVGIPAHPGQLDPEHAPALRRAIAEAGVDPATVLTPDQLRVIYGDGDTSKTE